MPVPESGRHDYYVAGSDEPPFSFDGNDSGPFYHVQGLLDRMSMWTRSAPRWKENGEHLKALWRRVWAKRLDPDSPCEILGTRTTDFASLIL